MNEDPLDWERRSTLVIAIVIVMLTSLVQMVILFNNTGYTMHYFGYAVAIVYITAAICYIALPWVVQHMPDFTEARYVQTGLLAFCSWVTAEEHLHAAEHFSTPGGLGVVASSIFPDTSRQVVAVGVVVLIFVAVELINRIQHHGIRLLYSCFKPKPKPRSRARKPKH